MLLGLLICFGYAVFCWLVFFKFRWIQFSITWGVVTVFVGFHLLLIFVIGLRFVTPYSTEAKMIQHTIQLTPRLSEPTLVTAVLVEQNVHVKKGTPLFQSTDVLTNTKSNSYRPNSPLQSRMSWC